MANWTVPSVKASGWAPRGRGWKQLGTSLGRGLENFASQWMAIKQYEAEKEEKRRKEQYDRAIKEAENLAKQEKERQDLMKWEMVQNRMNQTYEEVVRHNKAMEGLAGKRIKEEDKQKDMEAMIDKEFTNLDKLNTYVGRRMGKMLRDALMNGDTGKVKHVYDNILRNKEHMSIYTERITTSEGKEQQVTKPSNDANILLGVTQRTLPLFSKLYGEAQKGQYAYPLDQREELKKQLIEIQAMDDDAAARAIQQLIQGGIDPDEISTLIDELNQ